MGRGIQDAAMTPGAVSVQGLRKSYGDMVALDDVSLEVRPGEFLTLLGPSGCGKTTLLRLIAGFEPPDAGRHPRSRAGTWPALPPYKRPVNTVFQHYALFPHRTVAGNVAFGLEVGRPRRGRDRGAGRARARAGAPRRATASAGSTSSPAARSSAWPSPARSCSSPTCCSSTSRWPRSTRSSARRCRSS